MATWSNSVVLLRRAVVPMSVLFPPVVLLRSVLALAVLKLPVVCYRVQRDRWPCCSPPCSVVKKGKHSSGCVVRAGSVIQKRPRRLLPCWHLRCWQKASQHPHGRIEAADFVAVD